MTGWLDMDSASAVKMQMDALNVNTLYTKHPKVNRDI